MPKVCRRRQASMEPVDFTEAWPTKLRLFHFELPGLDCTSAGCLQAGLAACERFLESCYYASAR